MRNRVGLVVLAAAPVAALLAGVAALVAGGSLVVAILVAVAVGLLGGLQALVIVHLRRLRRRLDQVGRSLSAPGKATFVDRTVDHGGQASCRMDDLKANPVCRLIQ